MSRECLKDNIAKAIADAAGHGMREKCERHADAVLDVLAQRDAHLSAQAKVRVTDDVSDRIRNKLPIIRARTGNMLFDAGVNDACDKIEAMLAAPQPPEGALVVPKCARLAYFALCEERAAYDEPLAHVNEAIAALIAEYGAEQLAAPTLAGKEGK